MPPEPAPDGALDDTVATPVAVLGFARGKREILKDSPVPDAFSIGAELLPGRSCVSESEGKGRPRVV